MRLKALSHRAQIGAVPRNPRKQWLAAICPTYIVMCCLVSHPLSSGMNMFTLMMCVRTMCRCHVLLVAVLDPPQRQTTVLAMERIERRWARPTLLCLMLLPWLHLRLRIGCLRFSRPHVPRGGLIPSRVPWWQERWTGLIGVLPLHLGGAARPLLWELRPRKWPSPR